MTGAQLKQLGTVARQTVEMHCDRQFQQADLADAYVQCAADQLDQGHYTQCLQLLRRAGEVCTPYVEVHAQVNGERHDPTRDPRGVE